MLTLTALRILKNCKQSSLTSLGTVYHSIPIIGNFLRIMERERGRSHSRWAFFLWTLNAGVLVPLICLKVAPGGGRRGEPEKQYIAVVAGRPDIKFLFVIKKYLKY